MFFCLYSISTGEQLARWFWLSPRNFAQILASVFAGPTAATICLVYDLQSLKQIDDLYFANSITAHNFSADGKKLFVLTNDQTAFEFEVRSDAIKAADQ